MGSIFPYLLSFVQVDKFDKKRTDDDKTVNVTRPLYAALFGIKVGFSFNRS